MAELIGGLIGAAIAVVIEYFLIKGAVRAAISESKNELITAIKAAEHEIEASKKHEAEKDQ